MTGFSFDATAESFAQSVLAASNKVPVLVDFWAPWCAPCRALKPILEKLAAEYQGRFLLAKVNSDENQDLAMQFGVRGIPNVKAFVNGELADEFSGALPESALREFIERLLPSPAEELRQQAMQAYAADSAQKALAMLAEAAQMDPAYAAISIDRAEILLALHDTAAAQQLLDALPPLAQDEERVQKLRARIQFAQSSAAASSADELRAKIAADQNDLAARLALANLSAANQDYPTAFEQLLEIVRRDRGFQDDIGRKTMLSLFNLLGSGHELVGQYRRRLASALH